MFQVIDTKNKHLPVKSGFHTPAQAYKWAKKNLPPNSCGEWGKMKYFVHRYYIKSY